MRANGDQILNALLDDWFFILKLLVEPDLVVQSKQVLANEEIIHFLIGFTVRLVDTLDQFEPYYSTLIRVEISVNIRVLLLQANESVLFDLNQAFAALMYRHELSSLLTFYA